MDVAFSFMASQRPLTHTRIPVAVCCKCPESLSMPVVPLSFIM